MPWKLKCLALHVLAHAPRNLAVYRWLQRRVTGRYLDHLTDDLLAVYNYHVQNFLSLRYPSDSRVLEFGAGRSLLTSLLLSAAGAREVFAYDIVKLATVEQINHVIRQLRDRDIPHVSQSWCEIENTGSDLERLYNIYYRAPGDVCNTDLDAGSVDFICSTSTLEHIAREDIVSILREGRRLGSPSAIMSFIIDYHDHYATADPKITRFNFYSYSESEWLRFNPPNHFQNRLRHSDYEDLFTECGLGFLENRSIVPPDSEKQLGEVPMSAGFSQYSLQDLAALNGFFVLQVAR